MSPAKKYSLADITLKLMECHAAVTNLCELPTSRGPFSGFSLIIWIIVQCWDLCWSPFIYGATISSCGQRRTDDLRLTRADSVNFCQDPFPAPAQLSDSGGETWDRLLHIPAVAAVITFLYHLIHFLLLFLLPTLLANSSLSATPYPALAQCPFLLPGLGAQGLQEGSRGCLLDLPPIQRRQRRSNSPTIESLQSL